MSRIAYVNGIYLPHADASVHIEDRGYQFSDGVYEVWSIRNGVVQDHQPHLDRLVRSLSELKIPITFSAGSLNVILREIIRRNRVNNGMVYLQITRGVAPRDHAWPKDIKPSIVLTARSTNFIAAEKQANTGVKVISLPDIRWKRCDIKSVSLLPNILAKHEAKEQGAYEALLVDDQGFITEGSSTNAWIISQDNKLITRNISTQILSGVTRLAVIEIAKQFRLTIEERKFTVLEAQQAKEAFITAATALVMPVIQIDDVKINAGTPGSVTLALRKAYIEQGA
ncbi:D-amino-acid transaminase [Oceanicaulis sp. AH-315-P02]|nr:D-amino-acid transaminase [Oceanicaulis sp. AH-315-P02]